MARTQITSNSLKDNSVTPEKLVSPFNFSGSISSANLSGTNTGDQTSIVGITGTTAQFNTALTDGNFATEDDLKTIRSIAILGI